MGTTGGSTVMRKVCGGAGGWHRGANSPMFVLCSESACMAWTEGSRHLLRVEARVNSAVAFRGTGFSLPHELLHDSIGPDVGRAGDA